MATREEKIDLAGTAGLLAGAVDILKKQAPAIRDATIRQRVEYAMSLVATSLERVEGVIGE